MRNMRGIFKCNYFDERWEISHLPFVVVPFSYKKKNSDLIIIYAENIDDWQTL